jgi:hypothetical protein
MVRSAIYLLIVACAWSQPRIEIHPASGQRFDRSKETQRRLHVIQQSFWRDASVGEEVAVLVMAEKTYEIYFRRQIASESKIATFTEDGNDILVARWSAQANTRHSQSCRLGYSKDTSFIFRLPPQSWSNDSVIRAGFNELLKPPSPSSLTGPADGVALNIGCDLYGNRLGVGKLLLKDIPRQMGEGGVVNWIDLWETPDSSYLSVTFGTVERLGVPPNMGAIAERFPPLKTRVIDWSARRLLDELGAGNSCERDRVLAHESSLLPQSIAGALSSLGKSRLRFF